MTASSPTTQSMGVTNFATGVVDPTAGEAIEVTLGFIPRHIVVWNEDLVERYEKFEGMSATQTIKTVTAGTMTLDTGSAIVIDTDGTFSISATVAGTGDRVMYAAWG